MAGLGFVGARLTGAEILKGGHCIEDAPGIDSTDDRSDFRIRRYATCGCQSNEQEWKHERRLLANVCFIGESPSWIDRWDGRLGHCRKQEK
jgi:hypothetical protein